MEGLPTIWAPMRMPLNSPTAWPGIHFTEFFLLVNSMSIGTRTGCLVAKRTRLAIARHQSLIRTGSQCPFDSLIHQPPPLLIKVTTLKMIVKKSWWREYFPGYFLYKRIRALSFQGNEDLEAVNFATMRFSVFSDQILRYDVNSRFCYRRKSYPCIVRRQPIDRCSSKVRGRGIAHSGFL